MRTPCLAGLVVLLATACGDPLIPGSPPPIRVSGGRVDAALATGNLGKADVCHRQMSGGYNRLNVSANAVPAHMDHGDGAPGKPVPGDKSKVFDAECVPVDAVACPCRFTLRAIEDLNARFGDLGRDYDFVSTNLVTQMNSRANLADRKANPFFTFQAPGPDWPQANVCVTRVYDAGFAIRFNEELRVTPQEANACVEDLHKLRLLLRVP